VPRIVAVICLALVISGGLDLAWRSVVQAQEEPATGGFLIRVFACEREPEHSVGMAAADPPDCVRVDGVTVYVAAPDGRPIASCVTGQAPPSWGECRVAIPNNDRVVVTEETSTLPAGYLPRQNPIVTRNYSEFAGTTFVNLPADQIAAMPTVAPIHTAEAAPTLPSVSWPSLTIHLRRCPFEFQGSDYFGTCHEEPIPDTTFTVRGADTADAVTDTGGNVTIAGLSPGRYVVSGGPPGDFVRNAIYCARAARPGDRFPFTRLGTVEIALDLWPDEDVICDWFSVPEYRGGPTPTPHPSWDPPPTAGGTITIHGKICPDQAVAADCLGFPVTDAWYRLDHLTTGGGSTAAANAAGTVTFDLAALGAGPLHVTGVAPSVAPDALPFIICTAAEGSLIRPTNNSASTPSGVSFEARLRPGDRAHCVII
jgi:hypothetical protein